MFNFVALLQPALQTKSVSEVDSDDIPFPHSGAGVQNQAGEVTPMSSVQEWNIECCAFRTGGSDGCCNQAFTLKTPVGVGERYRDLSPVGQLKKDSEILTVMAWFFSS